MNKSTPNSESKELLPQTRRRWVFGAIAAGATVAGVGLAWLRNNQAKTTPTGPDPEFWQLSFATPQGGRFQMASLRGKPLVVNFWATWCAPCIEELPLLSDFYQKNVGKGWQVLGLAVDQVDPVNRFLAQTPVSYAVAMAGMPGIELTRSLGNVSGGLPFTVVLGSDGLVAHRKIGRLSGDDLRSWSELN
jgi:thiol-disulfide isomerase/thioredoxin